MEDGAGRPIHTYLAEAQLIKEESYRGDHPSLDELAKAIQNRAPQLRH